MRYELIQGEGGKVTYMMKQKGANVLSATSAESAEWMLKQGKPHFSGEFAGYPLTADDVYFFAAKITEDKEAQTGAAEKAPAKASAKKKRLKDVVCE